MDILLLFSVFISFLYSATAQCGSFNFASYYADHMVFQQAPASPIIWGYANSPGLLVTVTMLGVNYEATSFEGADGVAMWSVQLDPQTDPGPVIIEATEADCTMTLNDVLFGDVYVCSGQSNMKFRLDEIDNPDDEIADAINYPNVRTFITGTTYADLPQYDLPAIARNWVVPTDTNMGQFSAVCWLFGRDLNAKFGYPIGLIQSAYGGTRIEAWSSPDALQVCFPDGVPPGSTPQNDPSALWNAMIHPFLNMTIYGAIWYQGEANQGNYQDYGCAIQNMVGDWRTKWHEATGGATDVMFPFGQVQLAAYNDNDADTGFPDVRWAQTYDMGYTPNTHLERIYTAIALDLPDFESPSGSIHPRYKRQIAVRLTYGVYRVGYGLTTEGPFQGPLPTSAVVDVDTVTITYDNGTANIEVRTQDNFELCCADASTNRCPNDGVWTLAPIASNTATSVTLTNPCSNFVTGMRYAWRESPCPLEMCSVYRVENQLPAPPYVMDV